MKDHAVKINIKHNVAPVAPNGYTMPRRRDVLKRTDGYFKVCRVRADPAGIREVVCTNGARTIFVPLSAVNLRLVGHYRNGIKLN